MLNAQYNSNTITFNADAIFMHWIQSTRALSHDAMEEIFDDFLSRIIALAEKTGDAKPTTTEMIQCFKQTMKNLVGNRGLSNHAYISNPDLLR